jgi:hypothetical protein
MEDNMDENVKNELNNTLKKVWKEVRRGMGYPLLQEPSIGPTYGGTAEINLYTKRIVIDPGFIEMFRSNGMEYDKILAGRMKHEVGHYRYHPYDLSMIFLEMNALKSYDNGEVGGPVANQIRLHFDDIVDNTMLITKGQANEIAESYRILAKKGLKNPVLTLSYAYYSQVSSGLGFGITRNELSKEMQERIDNLKRIDFLDRSNSHINIRLYARVINDMLKKDGQGEGDEEGAACMGMDLNKFSGAEIKKALADISNKVSIDDFKRIYKFALTLNGMKEDKMDAKDEVDVSIEYYKAIAEKYHIKVLNLPITSSESQYPSTMREWELSSDIRKLNIYRSFGKLMPGITKRWVYAPQETYSDKKKLPNSIIIIDSSGSMPNPVTSTSNAVVGAFAVAMAYTSNSANVDVINFSCSSSETKYKGEMDAFKALAKYIGGGTTPPVEKLEQAISDEKKDITVITDGFNGADESTINAFMHLLNEMGETNRVSYISIGVSTNEEYRRKYANIKFHDVDREEDIGSIILGDMRW